MKGDAGLPGPRVSVRSQNHTVIDVTVLALTCSVSKCRNLLLIRIWMFLYRVQRGNLDNQVHLWYVYS